MTFANSFSGNVPPAQRAFTGAAHPAEDSGRQVSGNPSAAAGSGNFGHGKGGNSHGRRSGAIRLQLGQRLWTLVLSLLLFTLYQVVWPVMRYAQEYSNTRRYQISEDELRFTLQYLAEGIFGEGSPGGYIVILVAVILAIAGFAYLDSRRQIDFYESQPVSRKTRFLRICTGNLLIFLIAHLIPLAAGLIISAVMGAMDIHLLGVSILQAFRCIALFLAVYAYGVLAVMLTGSTVIAALASCVLLGYEPALRVVIGTYLETYLDMGGSRTAFAGQSILSPVARYLIHRDNGIAGVLRLLLIFAVMILLAYLCYTKRRNEFAGIAVPWRPVRTVVKIALAVLGGLVAGLAALSVSTTTAAVVSMVIAALLIAWLMEIIYEMNLRAAFRHFRESLISAGAVLLLFAIFSLDLFGVKTWTPNPDKVADCAILDNNYFTDHYKEDGSAVNGPTGDYYREYMHLTDVNAVIDMIRACNEGVKNLTDKDDKYTMTVLYRMKNGENIERDFFIPEGIDPSTLDAVFGSEEFREGYFQIYHDEYVASHIKNGTMYYDNGITTAEIDTGLYEAFKAAYEKDLEQFDYSFTLENETIAGSVVLIDDSASDEAFQISYPVYEAFSGTTAFLKSHKVPVTMSDSVGDISRIDILPPGADYSITYMEGDAVTSVLYSPSDTQIVSVSDRDDMADLLADTVPFSFGISYSIHTGSDLNTEWTILVYGESGVLSHETPAGYAVNNVQRVFHKGAVPAQILQAAGYAGSETEADSGDENSRTEPHPQSDTDIVIIMETEATAQ